MTAVAATIASSDANPCPEVVHSLGKLECEFRKRRQLTSLPWTDIDVHTYLRTMGEVHEPSTTTGNCDFEPSVGRLLGFLRHAATGDNRHFSTTYRHCQPTYFHSFIKKAAESDFKFYTEDGETFKTFDDVQQAASFTFEKFPKQIETIPAVVERMQEVANYFPSEKTVRASLNKPGEQLDREDYLLVMEQYRLAHDIMFASTSGGFYDTLKEVCQQTAFERIISVAEGGNDSICGRTNASHEQYWSAHF